MILKTGIGSLPHTDINEAIDFSLKFDIPYYPQLPLLNIKHSMVYEGLNGFHGLDIDEEFQVTIRNRNPEFDSYKIPDNLIKFVDSLTEKGITKAKFQIIGFHTLKKILMNSNIDSEFIEVEVLPFYIQKLMLINSYLESQETDFLFFVDEPSLSQNSTELERELSFYEGAPFIDGIHCCAKVDLNELLKSSFKYLAIDVFLYIDELDRYKKNISTFESNGGQLVWGVIDSCHEKESISLKLIEPFTQKKVLIVSPSCGLAMSTIEDCENILNHFN